MLATFLKCSTAKKNPFANTSIALTNPNPKGTSANDYFGYVVSVDGNYAAIGAHQEDDDTGNESGAVYIYNIVTGALVVTIRNPNQSGISNGDTFGFSVGISGNYVIVGTPWEENAISTNLNSGKAYIYEATTGNLVMTLHDPNEYGTVSDDQFGTSVAISGLYAVVGAPYEDDASGNSSGKAYVFDIATGTLISTLNNPNPYGTSENDLFGFSVDICGNNVIVGAYQENDSSGTKSGKAYIFDATTGALLKTLNNPNPYGTSQNDYFGYSVAISGNYAIVGAYQEDAGSGSSSSNSGRAYIFNVSTGILTVTLNNPNPYGTSKDDYFGFSVDISSDYAIVGAYQEDDASGTQSGKAYIFETLTGSLVKTLNNPNPYGTSKDDYFGSSVAISGQVALVGAHREDDASGTQSGKAHIFY
jgi:FG-GAP repeat